MKLSEIMWVQGGYGSARRVMPFVLKGDLLYSLADDKIFQYDSKKSMFDNLYDICQTDYKYSTVIIGTSASVESSCLDVSNPEEPKVLGYKLPATFALAHKREYKTENDITVKEFEVKALAKHYTKQVRNSLNNFSAREM